MNSTYFHISLPHAFIRASALRRRRAARAALLRRQKRWRCWQCAKLIWRFLLSFFREDSFSSLYIAMPLDCYKGFLLYIFSLRLPFISLITGYGIHFFICAVTYYVFIHAISLHYACHIFSHYILHMIGRLSSYFSPLSFHISRADVQK